MDNLIQRWRKARELSQEDLAELLGCSQPQVQRLERGGRRLSLDWMRAAASALGVSPADLLIDQDNPDRLSEEEREIVQLWRRTPPKERARLRRMLRAFLDDPTSSSAA